jgi:Ca2+-binding RTX toxin-like protein
VLSTTLFTGTEAITLIGNARAQRITGNAGENRLNGGAGNDTLTGGAGADDFVFSTPLGAGNVDVIADFAPGIDDILLVSGIFGAIGPSLGAGEFRIGAAVDPNDFLLYDPVSGALTYDSNGSGLGGAAQIARLAPGLALTLGDFQIV